MRARFAAGILLLALLGGCAAPLPSSRDSGLMPDRTSYRSTESDAFSSLKATAKKAVGKGPNPDKARDHYTAAETRYRSAAELADRQRRAEFLQAADEFRKAAGRWPDSALEQDALFLAGEAYFFADHYPKANEAYELLLKKYPHTKHLDAVESRRFAIADYWLKLNEVERQAFWEFNFVDRRRPMRDTFGHAVRVFDRIRIDDPTGKLADDATLAAGNAYFTAGRYLDADSFYTDLRKTFPSSEHQFRAHLLGVKAKLLSYRGPDYAGDLLDEAEQLIKQIRRQFPREAEQEREYLTRAFAEVRFKKAEREYQMARYYDRRSEYGAARFYYELLAADFGETPYAELAQARLGEIRDEPGVPPQRLAWLVAMFPEQEDVKPLVATSDSGAVRR